MPVKSVIDDHIQRLFDALLNSLRKAIEKEAKEIETFLNASMEMLSKRPQSTDEIAEANTKHAEFAKTRREVRHPPYFGCRIVNKMCFILKVVSK